MYSALAKLLTDFGCGRLAELVARDCFSTCLKYFGDEDELTQDQTYDLTQTHLLKREVTLAESLGEWTSSRLMDLGTEDPRSEIHILRRSAQVFLGKHEHFKAAESFHKVHLAHIRGDISDYNLAETKYGLGASLALGKYWKNGLRYLREALQHQSETFSEKDPVSLQAKEAVEALDKWAPASCDPPSKTPGQDEAMWELLTRPTYYENDDIANELARLPGPESASDIHEQLREAVYNDDKKVFEEVVAKKADINSVGGFFGTALQIAASLGREGFVSKLLRLGANVDVQGGVFGTAIRAASFMGHQEIVYALLKHGANPNLRDELHGTALQAALTAGHADVVKVLSKKNIENGADPYISSPFYGNALHEATMRGQADIVQMISLAGVNPEVYSGCFGTPLAYAKRTDQSDIAKKLAIAERDNQITICAYGPDKIDATTTSGAHYQLMANGAMDRETRDHEIQEREYLPRLNREQHIRERERRDRESDSSKN